MADRRASGNDTSNNSKDNNCPGEDAVPERDGRFNAGENKQDQSSQTSEGTSASANNCPGEDAVPERDGRSNAGENKQDQSSQTSEGTSAGAGRHANNCPGEDAIPDGDGRSNAGDNKQHQSNQTNEGASARRYGAFAIPAAVLGGVAAVAVAPVAVAAVGFGAGGIAAGSLGAGMMSTAMTSGFGMGAVSVLQSIGAAGMGLAGTTAVGTTGGVLGAGIGTLVAKLTGKRYDASQEEIAEAAAAAVFPGDSYVGGRSTETLLQDGSEMTCCIVFENWTCFPLVDPQVQQTGILTLPPCMVIAPGAREMMAAHKTVCRLLSLDGIVSWMIHENNRRFLTMWSIPTNPGIDSNVLAVGLAASGAEPEHGRHDTWFSRMYNNRWSSDLEFSRAAAVDCPVLFRNADFEIVGSMTPGHKVLIKIILRPRSPKNLAGKIKEKVLENQKQRSKSP